MPDLAGQLGAEPDRSLPDFFDDFGHLAGRILRRSTVANLMSIGRFTPHTISTGRVPSNMAKQARNGEEPWMSDRIRKPAPESTAAQALPDLPNDVVEGIRQLHRHRRRGRQRPHEALRRGEQAAAAAPVGDDDQAHLRAALERWGHWTGFSLQPFQSELPRWMSRWRTESENSPPRRRPSSLAMVTERWRPPVQPMATVA